MKRLYASAIIAIATIINAIAQSQLPHIPVSTPEPHTSIWERFLGYCIFAAVIGGIAGGFRYIKERIQDYLERRRARKIQQQAQPDDTPYGTYYNSKHKKVIIMPPLEPGIDDQSETKEES